MIDRSLWVYDIETLKSCFTYTAINIDTQEIVQYVIHKDRNDIEQLINHLNQCKGQIGFNNINFDYPIIHYILNHVFKQYSILRPIEELVDLIYNEAQRIIEEQNKKDFNTIVAIKQSEVLIPQLDLFKIWHFNNKARSTSLKALQIAMNYPNVMEMPIDHTRDDIKLEEISSILEYNLNDVLSTYEFYKRSIDKIELRKSLQKTYNLPCINWSDSKIGENLILKLYCDENKVNPYDIKKMRSNRSKIAFKDIIFNYIKFNSKEFNLLHRIFNTKIITETKGSISESVIYKGFKYDYGSGGIHGCIEPGVYISDNEYVIIDADVASLYPNIAIQNNLYIEHLGQSFIHIYDNNIVKERLKAKKEGNMIISNALKLSANSVYGKSNDINSFLYDPKYTMATTINGQLLLTMLAEQLVDNIPFLQVLQINTDGITVKIPRLLEQSYNDICKEWEIQTKLTLEYIEYNKMVIRDVNNYLAVTTKGKVKYKGAFEIDKDYHKDSSFKIIPIALSEYFVKNIPIEETIKNHTNIYEFCGRQKFTRESYGMTHELGYDITGNPVDITEKQQKNVRYYISNKGKVFYKYYNKGTNEIIHNGYKVTIFNKFKDELNYDINYNFYIKEANKIIDTIEIKQLKLEL